MRGRMGIAAVIVAALALAVMAPEVRAQAAGAGGIWVQKRGDLVPTRKTGDRANFQVGADYVGTGGGGIVNVQAMRLSVDQTLRASYPGVTIAGVGDSTVFESSGASGGDTMLVITGDNVTVRGMSFDGRKYVQTGNVPGIYITGKNCTIERCTFRNFANFPIKVTATATNFHSIRNVIQNVGNSSGTPNAFAMVIDGADSVTVEGTEFGGLWGAAIRLLNGADFATVSGNRFGNSLGDTGFYSSVGIYADSTSRKLICEGNHFETSWGLDCDADSSLISGNIFNGKAWHSDGASFITFTGNRINSHTGGGAVFFEIWEDQPGIGFVVTNNDFYHCGQALQCESNLGTITGLGANRFLVFEGNRVWESTDAVGAVRFSSVAGGKIENTRVANNFIYKSTGPGIRFHWSGFGGTSKRFSKIDVIGNTIIEPGTFGIQTGPMGSSDSVSTMFISGNTVRAPGSGRDYDLSQDNWSYSGTAGGRTQTSTLIVDDVASIADTLTLGSGHVVGNPNVLGRVTVRDSLIVDGSGLTGKVRAGGNVETSGGHLVTQTTIDFRNTASNAANATILRQGSADAIEFRSPGSSSQGFYFKAFGGATTYANILPGAGSSGAVWSGGSVASVDSMISGGAFYAKTKAVVTDSLMVHGPVEIGRSATAAAALTVDGGNGATAADSATITLNGSTLGSSVSPAIRFLRGGITKGMFSAATSSFGVKTDSTTGIGMAFGWLGSAAAQWSSAFNGAGRKLAINKTAASAYLDVAGNGIFTDSLRVNRGLQVGETTESGRIMGIYTATGTLDFASGTVGDLTISVANAAVGDPVVVGVPNGSVTTTAHFSGWVSSAGTVTVRCARDATEDPASGTYRVTVLHY